MGNAFRPHDRRLGAIMAGYGLRLREGEVYYRFWLEDKLTQISNESIRAEVEQVIKPFLDNAIGSPELRRWMNSEQVNLPHGKYPYWQRFRIACYTLAKAEELIAGGDRELGEEVRALGLLWKKFCVQNEKGESLPPEDNWFEVCAIAGIPPLTGHHFSSYEEAQRTLDILESFRWPEGMLRTVSYWIRITKSVCRRLAPTDEGATSIRRSR